MSTTTQVKKINGYIINFLQRADESKTSYSTEWSSKENQDSFIKLIKKLFTSGKKIKDPKKPKRGRSAYIFYCSENRALVKKDLACDEGVKITEITTELGRRWQILNSNKSTPC